LADVHARGHLHGLNVGALHARDIGESRISGNRGCGVRRISASVGWASTSPAGAAAWLLSSCVPRRPGPRRSRPPRQSPARGPWLLRRGAPGQAEVRPQPAGPARGRGRALPLRSGAPPGHAGAARDAPGALQLTPLAGQTSTDSSKRAGGCSASKRFQVCIQRCVRSYISRVYGSKTIRSPGPNRRTSTSSSRSAGSSRV
jgi:hypothetical protein